MALFSVSALLSCFLPKAFSRVSDDAQVAGMMKKSSSEKTETKSQSKGKGAPIVVSYFPVNSYLSRL
ncbi:PREDICTED: uncharacterized protein LOC108662753 [Theobroma cacao]|uniref:Uncharacterized protein LOC108662753 n=1 Tax=Theobroma cacao TaxID=3641 RepID=A0AB32WQ52_THECC|nr:PREDICTED: uncharacterized protein LOC108662753 [Theobroma cacao]